MSAELINKIQNDYNKITHFNDRTLNELSDKYNVPLDTLLDNLIL